MKKIIIVVILAISLDAVSQNFLSVKDINFTLKGFVRNDFIFDSHRNVDACDHLFEIFPSQPEYDSNGEDINAQPSAKFLNTFTRFGTQFTGLELGKAQVGAYVEVDFTGGSATNSLRLRHAYTEFIWPKSKLLFGRTWHPLFIEKVFPSTLNENTGVPFQAFNRSPQLRFTHQLSANLDFIAGAVYQFKYSNTGPDGKTYRYQREAVVPNLHAQLQYYNKNWVVGAALDWKSIQPRASTTGINGTFKTNEKLNTIAALAYLKYSSGNFVFKAKSMYGQNVCESLLPSGYAVASINSQTGYETYTPLNHVYNWVNFTYGKTWRAGLFAGYLKNMGTTEDPAGPFYGFGIDNANNINIDMIYRISPQLIYNYKNFMFGWEISLTTASYGQMDYNDKGKVKDTDMVTNFRNMIGIAYKF